MPEMSELARLALCRLAAASEWFCPPPLLCNGFADSLLEWRLLSANRPGFFLSGSFPS
jgi:hypothetical protein